METTGNLNICLNQKIPPLQLECLSQCPPKLGFPSLPGLLTIKAERVVSRVLVSVGARRGAFSEKHGILFGVGHLVGWAAGDGRPKGVLMGAASVS